ncbi:DUF4352 domain-containing protein [Patescibacteria group bacterium]|nr:MAG: DUF4352 domain-containing protein [Patescibacteria group bacterium]
MAKQDGEKKTKQAAPTSASKVAVAAGPQSVTGIGIAALVVGIVAFLSGLLPIWGLIVAAAAIVLSIIALKKSAANKPFGIAGIILGAVAALTNLIVTAFWVIAIVATVATGGAAIQATKVATDVLSAQDAAAKAEMDAKKDFAKGETARFGTFDVKVNSVDTNYQSTDGYSQPDTGNKYVLVNVTVTNPGPDSVSVSDYDLQLSADGVSNTNAYLSVNSPFSGGTLAKGASLTGNLVYSVPTTASKLLLTYDTTVFTTKPYKLEKLTYTLAL